MTKTDEEADFNVHSTRAAYPQWDKTPMTKTDLSQRYRSHWTSTELEALVPEEASAVAVSSPDASGHTEDQGDPVDRGIGSARPGGETMTKTDDERDLDTEIRAIKGQRLAGETERAGELSGQVRVGSDAFAAAMDGLRELALGNFSGHPCDGEQVKAAVQKKAGVYLRKAAELAADQYSDELAEALGLQPVMHNPPNKEHTYTIWICPECGAQSQHPQLGKVPVYCRNHEDQPGREERPRYVERGARLEEKP